MTFIFEKHFTLKEANALIPAIQRVFSKIFELVAPPEDVVPLNGNGNGHKAPMPTRPQDRVEAANELLRQISEQGIIIQDWRRGLIDFPHLHDGREILLCYELEDGDSVQFFHDVQAGYAGRLPLSDLY